MKTGRIKRYGGAALWALACAAPAAAQESAPGEIIVTAQKRAQNAQDVGVAITALSGDQLQKLGVSTSSDLVAQTPGLQLVSPNGGSSNYFSLRGVTQNDFGDHQESPVATYVDEVYVSQSAGTGFQLFDIDRVEVLRGPQGTLFGRNATGGLVHFLTRRPTFTPNGYVTVGLGSYDQVRAEGAYGGPISDTLAFRLSAETNHHDGYVKNRLGRDLNNGNDNAARLQLLFKPTDDFQALLSVRGTRQQVRAGAYEHATSVLGADGLGRYVGANENPYGTCPGCDPNGYADTDGNPYAGDYDKVGYSHIRTFGTTANLSWDTGPVTLHSITDYSYLRKRYTEDSDASPTSYMTFTLGSDVDQFSQELRADGKSGALSWVAGLYFLSIDGTYSSRIGLPLFDTDIVANYRQKTRNYSAFGQMEYALSPRLSLIGGLRWSEDRKSIDYLATLEDNAGADLGTVFAFSTATTPLARMNKGNWSARAQVNFKPVDTLLLYASWNRGLKGGGFNAPADVSGIFDASGQADVARMRFGNEVLYSYETGAKLTLPGGLGHINGALFHYDYDGYQAFDLQGLTQFVYNTTARISGADLEWFLAPYRGVTLSGGATFMDAKARNIPMPDGSHVTRRIVLAPDVTLNGVARYEWAIGGITASVQADAKYMSSHYFNISNAPTTYQKGYTVANARVGLTLAEGRIDVAAYVKNLTKTRYRVIAFDISSLGLTERYPGRPRWFGVEATLHLN